VLSSSTLNAVHVTYNATINDRPLPEYFSATDLGSRVVSPLKGYVGINVSGTGFSIGNGGTNPGYFNSKSFQIADDFDMIRGDHQIAFGANWIRTRIETLNNRPTNGAFTFSGQTSGLPLADFLLGNVSNFLQGNPVYDYDHNDYVGAYAQAESTLVAGLGYALVPQSVQNLHRDGVLYLPLSDEGVTTPVIMNRRRNDESELTTYLAEMVRSLPTSVRSLARRAE